MLSSFLDKLKHDFKVRTTGFTIVELLIVIVVIGVLAGITMTTYNGVQKSARDSDRKVAVETIAKALELFYTDNGYYPQIQASGSTTFNSAWSTSADVSWEQTATTVAPPYFNTLKAALVPKYISKLPRDPINTPNVDTRTSTTAYSYAYFGSYGSNYCNKPDGQMYLLVYRNEAAGVTDKLEGACPSPTVGPYGNAVSTMRIVK